MPDDIQKYRKHVEHFDLTDRQKDELICIVRDTMQNFVDRAFGDDPVQNCLGLDASKRALSGPVVIDLEAKEISRSDTDLTELFNKIEKQGKATNNHD